MDFDGASRRARVFNLPIWAEYIEAYPGIIREYNDLLTKQSSWRKEFEEWWFEECGCTIPLLERIPKEDAIRFIPCIPFLDSSFLSSLNSFMCSLSSSSSLGLSQTFFDDVVEYEHVILVFEAELEKYRSYRKFAAESERLTESLKVAIFDSAIYNMNDDRALEILAHPLLNTEYSTFDGVTFLHCAARFNRSRLLEPIMEKTGLGINCRTKCLRTPLFCAVESGSSDAVRTLIRLGANVDQPNSVGNTPLADAVQWDLYDAAEILLDNGADINAVNNRGDTPLFILLEAFHRPLSASMLRLLLIRGANIEHRNNLGRLPIELVPRRWRDDVKAIFEVVAANRGRLPVDYLVSSTLFQTDIICKLEDNETLGLTLLFDE
jgi:hypothetical protein